MRTLLLVVATIFALNVAYASFLVLSELVDRWRARREVGSLEAMWHTSRTHAGPRARGSAVRVALTGVALLLLSGLTVASPTAREVVSRVTGAIGGIGGDPSIEAAPPGSDATGSAGLAPTVTATASPEPSTGSSDPRDAGADPLPGEPDPRPREAAVVGRVTDPTEVPPVGEGPAPGATDPEPSAGAEPTPPPQVTFHVEARATSSTMVDLEWDDVASVTRYDIERSVAGEDVWTSAGSSSPGHLSTTLDGFVPGVTYDIRVTAVRAQGDPLVARTTVEMPAG